MQSAIIQKVSYSYSTFDFPVKKKSSKVVEDYAYCTGKYGIVKIYYSGDKSQIKKECNRLTFSLYHSIKVRPHVAVKKEKYITQKITSKQPRTFSG